MNTSSSFITGKIFSRSKLYPNQIFPHTINLYNEKFDWLFIVDPNWLVWNTYIPHSLTDSLTDLSTIHNILDAPTKRYFFYKKITQKPLTRWKFDLIKLHFYLAPRVFKDHLSSFHTFYLLKVSDWKNVIN